jgi:hypothetical protein
VFLKRSLEHTGFTNARYNVSTIKKLQYHEINPSQLKNHIKIPFTFEQAWNNNDPWCCNKWREAINIELKKMEDLKV